MDTFTTNYYESMIWFFLLVAFFISETCIANEIHHHTVSLSINVSAGRPMPPNLFCVFFEETNYTGVGGLWAELINNRGFEAGGRDQLIPSTITPWDIIGDKKTISIAIEKSSCLENNPMALRMDVHCDQTSCPPGGVGIYNPGYWRMNIEQGKSYKVVFYVKCSGPLEAFLSLVSADGMQILAINHIRADAEQVSNWTRMETVLNATSSDPIARFQFLTTQIGTIWLDQISVMPIDTYMGHGFRKDLMEMIHNLKPRFLRFPGGCYVEGEFLRNAYRWKETVGPWEERPGHLNDVWHYWSDDGVGYLEYLQLAEDLGAEPICVINIGISHRDKAGPALLNVQDMLDSIEFARDSDTTKWGSLRSKMGHPAPFSLKHVALGNENYDPRVTVRYRDHYMKFYNALKQAYPDIKASSNCDRTLGPLDHLDDIYDYHRHTTVEQMLQLSHRFEKMPRNYLNEPKMTSQRSFDVLAAPGPENANAEAEGTLSSILIIVIIFMVIAGIVYLLYTIVVCRSFCYRNRRIRFCKTLPVEIYSDNGAGESSTVGGVCSICLEQFTQGEELHILPLCKHSFHRVCLGKWFKNHECRCPLCNYNYVSN